MFQTNSEVRVINMRHKHDLHQQIANLTAYQKGVYNAGMKLYNSLSLRIKCTFTGSKQF
jgi:hypothetical protein